MDFSLHWRVTPGMEEGGMGQDSGPTNIKIAKDGLRDRWKKLIESEERLNFLRKWKGGKYQIEKLNT